MRDNVYLVTGSTRGIGKQIAHLLLAKDAHVIVNAESQADEKKLAAEFGSHACFISADISKKEDIVRLRDEIVSHYGRLDGLVANAGVLPMPSGINDITEENIDKTINVNLKGTFWCLQILGKLISETSTCGSIVTITSVDGLIGEPFGVIYSATKAGIISLTQSFARNFNEPLVRVNAVAPGLVDTHLTEETGEDPKLTTDVSVIKRIGQPREIAEAVTFLLSSKASYITGQVLAVDGGFTLK